MTYKILHGNNLDILPTLADNSIDSIVTDPPYELGFMGKKWDSSGIAYSVELWTECLRVLKPGGHLLSFGGTRTYHRIAVAIEDAGFEIRDNIAWLYGSGFPKSLDVSKAIDKAAGAEREVFGRNPNSRENATKDNTLYESGTVGKTADITAPSTPEAQQWEGWGTALKPAHEPIIVARKPIQGTVANNVLTYGTGALNIDGSRIGTEAITINTFDNGAKPFGNAVGEPFTSRQSHGRWPANIILDEQTAGLLDKQSGHLHGSGNISDVKNDKGEGYEASGYEISYNGRANRDFGAKGGGASRFFYVAKASKRDRNEGLEELPQVQTTGGGGLTAELKQDGSLDTTSAGGKYGSVKALSHNIHPTVKPTTLMQYLVKLVTPPNGTVLDPFTGSGSTGKAAILEGFDFIGIEMTDEYLSIIEARLKHAEAKVAERIKETSTQESEKLF